MLGHEITFTPLEHSLIFFLAGISVGLRQMYAPAGQAVLSGLPTNFSNVPADEFQIAN